MAGAATYILLTGASSGIGRAIAAQLSRSSRLILHGRDSARLEETRRNCSAPDTHLLWQHDLRDTAGLPARLTEFLSANSATVVGFVHCAGVVRAGPARLAELDLVSDCLHVNFISAQQIITTLLKKRTNQGALTGIVLVSSIASRLGVRGHSVYCASKAALDGMMRALAVELAPQVRVNSVLPGAVCTPATAALGSDPDLAARLQADYPRGLGRPEDIADAVDFLLSPRSRWITGEQLVIDGGSTVDASL